MRGQNIPNLKHVIFHLQNWILNRRSDPGKNFPLEALMKEKVLTHSVLGKRHRLVTAAYSPPDPIDHAGNCCAP